MPKRKPGIRLPNKLSKMILATLPDLAKAERARGVVINMRTWHKTNGKCEVCWAGAVMRRAVPDSREAAPEDFSPATERKLDALAYLRTGDVSGALIAMNRPWACCILLSRSITPYDKDRVAFKLEMRKLAADLEQAGL